MRNTLREFLKLSRPLHSVSVVAKQAPLALSNAKVSCKQWLWLVARVNKNGQTICSDHFANSFIQIKRGGLDAAALFKSHCMRPHPIMKKKRKNLYNVLLALAFVFLWLYYRKEMWRMCDRFLKRKWSFLTESGTKGKEFI